MRLINKIATIWCIVALTGIVILLTVNLTAYYLSGAYMPARHDRGFHSIFACPTRAASYHIVFGIGPDFGPLLYAITVLWMMAGTVSVLLLGFYFVITATGTFRRVLAALCFLWPWALVVIMRSPRLIEWFLD